MSSPWENPSTTASAQETLQRSELYNAMAYYTDWFWGKSRTYLMPYWSTKYTPSQITEQIYISDLPSAFNIEQLKQEGFTHILNMIIGVDSIYPTEFKYKNIPARDIESQDLSQYFEECVDFIHSAVTTGGKVLVHCSQGISRSSTMVIAYLISQGMSYQEAFSLVKSKRQIINPNPGFVQQLVAYETMKNSKQL